MIKNTILEIELTDTNDLDLRLYDKVKVMIVVRDTFKEYSCIVDKKEFTAYSDSCQENLHLKETYTDLFKEWLDEKENIYSWMLGD